MSKFCFEFTESDVKNGIEQAAFTQQVDTANGPALLIGSYVIHLSCSNPELWVEVLSRALRRSLSDEAVAGATFTSASGDYDVRLRNQLSPSS